MEDLCHPSECNISLTHCKGSNRQYIPGNLNNGYGFVLKPMLMSDDSLLS